ncbi:copper chaperone PCu(A)C [Alteromonas ponticola]|uniref:Copper chaperone PCu(A)C n=1 Tax=Alteromonas aquimaris TaxID=2998417 RepID=A0ABT3P5F3_9ALTE|nr:copper chaperone PCu(A)C [Alteromonas aquimaris]MCW8107990.1 copper chaperone PCu(A)C [Alteromonas aquimaris]
MMKLRFLAAFILLGLAKLSHASTHQIEVRDVYAKATFAMATTAAVYMTLENQSDKERQLNSVTVDKTLADEAQIHTTQMVGEMAKMREVKKGVTLPSHQAVQFMPGGHHIMLLGLKRPLKKGDSFMLTLLFDEGASHSVNVIVRKEHPVPTQSEHHHDSHH